MLHHRVMLWFDFQKVTSLNLDTYVRQPMTQLQLPSLAELVTRTTRHVEGGLLHQLTSLTVRGGEFDRRLLDCTRLVRLKCDMVTILPAAPAPLFTAGGLQQLTLFHTYQDNDGLDNLWQLKTYLIDSNIRELYLRLYCSSKLQHQLKSVCDSMTSSNCDYSFTANSLVAHVNYSKV